MEKRGDRRLRRCKERGRRRESLVRGARRAPYGLVNLTLTRAKERERKRERERNCDRKRRRAQRKKRRRERVRGKCRGAKGEGGRAICCRRPCAECGRGLIVRTIVRKCVSTDERIDVHPRMLRRIGAYLSVSARQWTVVLPLTSADANYNVTLCPSLFLSLARSRAQSVLSRPSSTNV